MAGPINGSGLYGAAALKNNPEITLIIPTILQTSNDVLNQFTGLTCLYNKNWYNRRDKVTLPLCFFYIKNITMDREAEISQRRVIIYDPQQALEDSGTSGQLADPLRPGVQEVIADNTVIKPRTYSLEIVLPFQIGTGLLNRQMQTLTGMFEGFTQIFTGGGASVQSYFAPVQELFSLGNSVLESAARLPDAGGAAYINMHSLEAMQEAQVVLTFKMWTGYDYKYVMINKLSIVKNGLEDNVFRATMQLQEVPVLTVNAARDVTQPGGFNRNWAATAISFQNKALIDPLVALTGVGAASSGEANEWSGF